MDSLHLWLEHRVKGDYQDDKNTGGIKIRMLNDFPLMAPHHSLHQGQQSPLVRGSASHLRGSLGQELPQIKPTSLMNRLWGNSINIIALKCHQTPCSEGSHLYGRKGRRKNNPRPQCSHLFGGTSYTFGTGSWLFFHNTVEIILVKVIWVTTTNTHQISFFFLKYSRPVRDPGWQSFCHL